MAQGYSKATTPKGKHPFNGSPLYRAAVKGNKVGTPVSPDVYSGVYSEPPRFDPVSPPSSQAFTATHVFSPMLPNSGYPTPQEDPLQDGNTCASDKRRKDTSRSNSRSTFAQVLEAAWDHLETSGTHAIRRSCRDGLALHDRVCTDTTFSLGRIGTEEEVQGTLARAAARGFRPKSITVETIFSGEPGQDKKQAL